MSIRNLDLLLRPRSIAVIGASEREHTVGTAVMRNVMQGRFPGPVFPVHSRRRSVGGVHAYPDPGHLPEAPDLAVICTPADTVPGLVRSLGMRGTRAVAILTDGVDSDAVLAEAQPYMMRVLGPGSMGLLAPARGLNASFAPTAAAPGRLALVSQSGAVLAAALDWAAPRGIGFTWAVSLGDAADVDAADLLDYLGSDPGTHAVLLYIESLRNGRKFLSAARAVSRGKPVVVMKAGRTAAGAEAVRRHTGADAGDDDAFDAAVARAGMLRVYTVAELFEAAEVLGRMRTAGQSRLAIITNAGGPGVIAADAARMNGVELHGQPLDLGGDATGERYAAALAGTLSEDAQHTVLLVHAPSGVVSPQAVADACREAAAASGRVLACWMGGERAREGARTLYDAGIPVYETPEAAVRAFAHMHRYRRHQEALQEIPDGAGEDFAPDEPAARRLIARVLGEGRGRLTEAEARALVAAYGISVGSAHAASATAGARRHVLRAHRDGVFGMVIRFDAAVGLVPLNVALALAMIARDDEHAPAIATVIARLSQLLAQHPEIAELDIDPLHVGGAEPVALGIRGRVERTDARPGEHLAIRPYPRELEQVAHLKGGLKVLLRPVRPGDAAAYADFIEHTGAEDLRMRFFTLVRRLPARDLARYTQIDYDREMAFVAVGEDRSILGDVRIYSFPDEETAEFAILVRTDVHRHGLGRALLEKAIDYARSRGTAALIGQIRADNRPMLALARACGMAVELPPGSSLAVAHLDLRSTRRQAALS